MKRLYCLLIQLSLSEPLDLSRSEASLIELNNEISRSGFKESFQDLGGLADFLFKILDRMFRRVFDALCSISSGCSPELAREDTALWDNIKEFMLLLRSCLVILTLVASEQTMLLEKVSVLLSVLGKLMCLITRGKDEKNSISLESSFSHECSIIDSHSTKFVSEDFVASLCILEPSDPCHPFICAVLEVFVDELLMHRALREYFMLVDSISSASRRLFMHNLFHGGIGTVLEVISAHFILSISEEQAFYNFLNRLCWAQHEDLRVPELSLTASLSFLLNPVMLSVPKLFQAHFISLVSDAIGIGVFLKSPNPDHRLMDWYLIAFERAITLYNRHMSNLHIEGDPLNSNGSHFSSSMPRGNCQQPFKSYIQQVRREKIDYLVSKYENTYLFSRAKSDLLSLSISYVVDYHHILDASCKDDMLSILHSIIFRASLDDVNDNDVYKRGGMSHHDIYLLASILKLISSSMLPAIWCLRHCGNSGGYKILRDISSCKEYDFILRTISDLQKFDVCLPNQKLIYEVMKTHPKRHVDSKWIFLHFTGLLTLSFSRGVDFLVKDCILAIMMMLNLFVFEEGDLSALSSLVHSEKSEENLVHLKSNEAITIEFQNIQTLQPSTGSLTSFHQIIQDGLSQPLETSETALLHNSPKECTIDIEELEESCSGEVFLKCLLKGSENTSSCDDITDFIACKQGKDYLHWMKNRQRYRKWKSHRLALLRWERKKKIWKFTKAKKK